MQTWALTKIEFCIRYMYMYTWTAARPVILNFWMDLTDT
eukprot:COSAG02_NODE_4518_length_5271_cov_6.324439_2_plen_39_part_00